MLNWIKNELKEGRTLITYGMIRIGAHGFSFLIPIILTMQFTPEVFGIYSLSVMIVYFFNTTLILSSQKPSIIYGYEEIHEKDKISYTITSRIILFTISIAIFLLSVFLLKKQIIDFTKLTAVQIYFLLLVFVGKTIESFVTCIFLTLNKRIVESIFLMITAGFSILYLILIYLFFNITLEKVFLMFFFAPILSFCFFISKIEFEKIFPLAYDKDTLMKMVDYTKWMMLTGAAVYLLNWGDNIILRRFVTMDEIGVYNLGYQFFKGTIMVMAIISVYFLPFISQNIDNKEKITNYLLVKRLKLLSLGIILLGLLFLIIPYVVKLLYRGQYEASVIVFRILTFGSIFALYSFFYDPIFHSLKRYKLTQKIVVFCVIVNLLLDYVLVSRIGFVGAAIATSVSYFLIALLKEVYFRRYCKALVT